MIYVTDFRVTGGTPFPADMLRYDCCYPIATSDALAIQNSASYESPSASVSLRHYSTYAGWQPTEGRWASLGWAVVPGTVEVTKVKDIR